MKSRNRAFFNTRKELTMSHHGENPFEAIPVPEDRARMEDIMRESLVEELGATRRFPEGKLAKGDQGEIMFAVGHQHNKVTLDFGKSVAWIGMNPDQAKALAVTIFNHADKAQLIASDKTPTKVKVGS